MSAIDRSPGKTPLPQTSSRVPWRLALVGIVLVLLGILPMQFAPPLFFTLLIPALIDATFATSVGFLARQTGKISFGHAGFFGLAAYTSGILFKRSGFNPELALLLALALPTVLGLFLGFVFARIPGVAHAMLTLAVGQGLYEVAFKFRTLTNGDDGLTLTAPASLLGLTSNSLQTPSIMFLLCWAVLVMLIIALLYLSRTPFGDLTEAIRDNPERAKFIGYSIVVPSAIVYAISAFIAACAGVLFALYNLFVTPINVHWSTSGMALVMAIIGGPRYIIGPALGAIAYFFIKEIVGDVSELWPAIVGGILIVVTLIAPEGIAGLPARLRSAIAGRRKQNAGA